MAFVKSFRDGILTLSDGDGTPTTLLVALAEGDLKVDEAQDPVILRNRGALLDVKKGDEVPLKVSFGLKFENFSAPYEAASPLSGSIVAGTTAFSPVNGAAEGFTDGPSVGILYDPDQGPTEVFSWTNRAGNQLQGCVRGLHGTTAAAWNATDTLVAEIELATRTVRDFLLRDRGYAGLVTTRTTSDRFCCDLIFSVKDVDGNVEEIATLSDFFVEQISFDESGDYCTMTVTGMAWATAPSIT